MRTFGISEVTTLAAGAASGNILQGTRLAPAIYNGMLNVWSVATGEDVDMKLLVQSDEVCSEYEISSANRYPEKDKDMTFLGIPVQRGDVVSITFNNRNAATRDVTTVIEFNPSYR